MRTSLKPISRLLSLFLALVLVLGLSAPVLAEEADGGQYSALVLFEEGADPDRLCEELEDLPGVSVRWRYSALLFGAAIEGSRAALALAGEQAGVEAVAVSRMWTKSEATTELVAVSNSLDVMNGLELEYDGDGIVVAVLDSGIKVNHEAFGDYGNLENPALGEEDIDAFTAAGGTDGRYVSVKIPYAYDYRGKDRSVHTLDAHGTHVSALAVGYAEDAQGRTRFSGAAPAAQLLCMKVFPDNAELGAHDTDILKAMEDAYLLGADVINLSLGMAYGFFGDERIGKAYSEVLARLAAEGVIVCCAVGNESMSLAGKTGNTSLPTGAYTDYGMANAPAIYEGAEAIAAVNAAFYEAGGGILAGDRRILYTKAIFEDQEKEGQPPNFDMFSGETLEYVVVGGLGSAEDFAGLELTGCVALVQRGELLFSEKVNNAAAAGAVACIIYNNEAGRIIPAVSDTTIPCIVISDADGAYLVERAERGRGTLAVAPYRMQISTGERLTMLAQSSWGATALSFAPALSAPGGIVLSASVSANNAYEYLSGTSMAAPNASGAYAVVLQALRERGVEDKKERAELARSLLESTAVPVTDANGVPVSPRRQGAGVIDLAAALKSSAVICDPLLELGESENGWFTMSFTVKNLSQEKMTFTWDATVLTDGYVHTDGSWRSTLTAQDITDRVRIMGAPRFSVNAGEETTVTLTLALGGELREELNPVCPNGFFAEGFLTLTNEAGARLQAAFLGYCGDWEKAPILEQVGMSEVMDAYFEQETGQKENALAALTVNMGCNLALLCDASQYIDGALLPGENPKLATPYEGARNAMSTADSDAFFTNGDCILIDLYTLRNAEHVIMTVTDRKTGEIYYVSDLPYLARSAVSDELGEALPAARFFWNGTDRDGQALPDGTQVEIRFYAWLESEEEISRAYRDNMLREESVGDYSWLLKEQYRGCIEWEFPLVLDGEAPEISCGIREDGAVELKVTDEHFVSYISVQSETGEILAEEAYAGTVAGEKLLLAVVPEGQMLYVTVSDYAGNTVGYAVDLDTMETARCPMAIAQDVDKTAWYHEAVDFVLMSGLMEMGDGQCFAPDGSALRVQVLEMLYQLAGSPAAAEDGAPLPFTDLRGKEPYLAALEWAYRQGIVTGHEGMFFGAYMPVRRGELAAMLWRAAQARGDDISCEITGFADEVPEWAADALCWAAEQGYLTADEEGRINPSASVTRAELAYLMMIFFKE